MIQEAAVRQGIDREEEMARWLERAGKAVVGTGPQVQDVKGESDYHR